MTSNCQGLQKWAKLTQNERQGNGHAQQGKWYKQDIDFERDQVHRLAMKKSTYLGLSLTGELARGAGGVVGGRFPGESLNCRLHMPNTEQSQSF